MPEKHHKKLAPDDFWIAVDWGTSSLRCWAMQGNQIAQVAESSDGMNQLTPEQFEPALLNLIDDWLPASGATSVFACGMVGAKQGWIEAPYTSTPCNPCSGDSMIKAPVQDSRFELYILPGISQQTPADVMRGEETLIAGLLSEDARFSGVICLPGTHCKWVEINQGEIQRFNTVITGELFDLLSTQSVLRFNTTAKLNDSNQDQYEDVFIASVKEHATASSSLTKNLFSIRAHALLKNEPSIDSTARLSGLLIAADVHSMQHYWQSKQCIVVGEPTLARLYELAILTLANSPDTKVIHKNMDNLALKGLSQIAEQSGAV